MNINLTTKTILFTSLLFFAFVWQNDFVSQQKKYKNVRAAYSEKEQDIKAKLQKENIRINQLQIMMIAYKAEKKLDLYARNKNDNKYQKIETYDICASSGELGPKRIEGDGQVPEGFYHINVFNPTSNFYLSLGINYPNASDLKKSNAQKPGGNIFIHGSCVTIGCLPMTDDKIKEIYVYAVQARQSGQAKIPVYIFPFKMNENNMKNYEKEYKGNTALVSFWKNLKQGSDAFDKTQNELKISTDKNGSYLF